MGNSIKAKTVKSNNKVSEAIKAANLKQGSKSSSKHYNGTSEESKEVVNNCTIKQHRNFEEQKSHKKMKFISCLQAYESPREI